jgi:hypothetical protein
MFFNKSKKYDQKTSVSDESSLIAGAVEFLMRGFDNSLKSAYDLKLQVKPGQPDNIELSVMPKTSNEFNRFKKSLIAFAGGIAEKASFEGVKIKAEHQNETLAFIVQCCYQLAKSQISNPRKLNAEDVRDALKNLNHPLKEKLLAKKESLLAELMYVDHSLADNLAQAIQSNFEKRLERVNFDNLDNNLQPSGQNLSCSYKGLNGQPPRTATNLQASNALNSFSKH